MNNLWTQTEFSQASWYADLTPLAEHPSDLLSFLEDIYQSGLTTEIFVPSAPTPLSLLRQRWQEERVIQAFETRARIQSSSKLTWYDRSNARTVGMVSDLGELLASLEPAPNTISKKLRIEGYSPVQLLGESIRYNSELKRTSKEAMIFVISLHSDIWFPYVRGFAHPATDLTRFFDNRELAGAHTPRLNVFIRTVQQRLANAGVELKIDPQDSARSYLPWVTPTGIALDTRAPEMVPSSSVDVPWPASDD